MAITKTLEGLVVADNFDRADNTVIGGNWVEVAGNWAIVSNKLKITGTGNYYIHNTSGSIGEMFVQTVLRGKISAMPALMARYTSTGGANAYILGIDFNAWYARLYKAVNGTVTQIAATSKVVNSDTDYPAQLYVKDSLQQGWVDGTSVSGTDTAHNGQNARTAGARYYGDWSDQYGIYNDFIWCRSKDIVVSGMEAGCKAKVLNSGGSTIAWATESGGTATIDCSRRGGATAIIPVGGWAKVIITDAADNLLDTYDAEPVYPGSTYEAASAPTAPVISAASGEVGQITITLTSGGDGADTIALYGADSADDLPEGGPEAGADLLDADWGGSTVEGSLGDGVTRYYRAYAENDSGTTASNLDDATTLDVPTAPVLTLLTEACSHTISKASGGSGADTIALYRATSSADLPSGGAGVGATLLDADWDGTAYEYAQGDPSITTYFRAYAENGAGVTASDLASAAPSGYAKYTLWGEYDTGDPPPDWDGSADATVEAGSTLSGKQLYNSTEAYAKKLWETAEVTDADAGVLCLGVINGVGTVGVTCRGGHYSAIRNYDILGAHFRLLRDYTVIAEVDIVDAAGPYWIRLVPDGNTIRGRTWAKGVAEPAGWTLSVADTNYPDAGGAGVILQRSGAPPTYYASSWYFSTEAITVPGAPSVSLAADSTTQFTATITPGHYATDHELYVALSPTGLFAPANLYADSLGAAPAPVVVTSRGPGLTYYVGVRAINAYGDNDSAIVSITMAEDVAPALLVDGITTTGATLNLLNVEDASADEVQYQTTTAADTTYTSPVEDITITEDTETDSRFVHPIGVTLTADTDYRSRVRYRTTGGVWSAWIEITWSTAVEPPPQDSLTYWFTPAIGELVTGTLCPRIALEKPRTITSIDISDDDGVTWTPLSFTLTEFEAADDIWQYVQFCFDTTAYTDGHYHLRLTLDDGQTVEHYGFRINNNPDGTLPEPVFAYAASVPMAKYRWPLEPLGTYKLQSSAGGESCVLAPRLPPHVWSGREWNPESQQFTYGCVPAFRVLGRVGVSQYGGDGDDPSYGPIEPAWLADNLGADVTAVFYSMTAGSGFIWNRVQGAEVNYFAIGLCTPQGNNAPTFQLRCRTGLLSPYISGTYELSKYWSHVGVGTDGIGALVLSIGDDILFSKPIPSTWGGWTSFDGSWSWWDGENLWNCWSGACGVKRPIKMRLAAWRPDPEVYPRQWHVIGQVYAPWIPDINAPRGANLYVGRGGFGGTMITIDEIVDLDFDVPCGGIVFSDHRVWGQQEMDSGRFLYTYTALPLEVASCSNEPPPPSLECDVAVDCYTATLTVNATTPIDQVRFRITTSTDIGFAAPIIDTGFVEPVYVEDPEFGQTGAAYATFTDLDSGNYLAQISVMTGDEEYSCDAAVAFEVESWPVPELDITSPNIYGLETWDRVIRWTSNVALFTVEYKIPGGEWTFLAEDLTSKYYQLTSEEDSIIGNGPVSFRVCAYTENECNYICLMLVLGIGISGVRRILFGQPGEDSTSLDLAFASKRRIIFGSPGD